MVKENDNYLVIVSVDNKELSKMLSMLKNNGINNIIPDTFLTSHARTERKTLNSFQNFKKNNNTALIVASPPKTGNVTISKTLDQNDIDFVGLVHTPYRFQFHSNYDTVKVITAIREPIIQNISLIYQELSAFYQNSFNYHLYKHFKSKQEFLKDVNNIYPFFNLFNQNKEQLWSMFYIDKYMESFNSNIINLYAHEFDKEKGYCIIKEGNIEVFVYQLEKMNFITEDLSNWIGQNHFNEWIKGNEASGKWIDEHYKQVKKEIKFSQEYFDNSYNSQWVQHFYSKEDIEKFKDKWRSHIK